MPLDTPGGIRPPSAVRLPLCALLALAPAAPLLGQAPPSADLWRVAAASLTGPAALEQGPTSLFWNPAAEPNGSRLALGGELIQTSDILGLSGVLVGARHAVRPWLHVGIVLARMEVRDLVRTTTSPSTELGSIPVYEQLAGVGVGAGTGPLQVAALLRVHDAKFDALDESGVTLDVGVRLHLAARLRLAAATHFLPADLSAQSTTDYYMGAEYDVLTQASLAGAPLRAIARYGVAYRPSGALEHALGAGAVLGDRVGVDAVLVSESAFGRRTWRPTLGVSLRVGRYAVGVARSTGLNDVGATYRIGLDVELLR